jgi:RNA recognition motif-containing protein
MLQSIFVGNLPDSVTQEKLTEVFSEYGTITKVSLPMAEGNRRGFGFVEMEAADAAKAIAAVNGMELEGSVLSVNEARPRKVA